MRVFLLGACVIATLLAIAGCTSGGESGGTTEPGRAYPLTKMSDTEAVPDAPSMLLSEEGSSFSVPQERLIARTADLDILVNSVPLAMLDIGELVDIAGGFVVSSQRSGEDDSQIGWMSVRVPAEQLDVVMLRIRELAVRVTRESTSAQDITEEYVDLDSRLDVLKKAEAQYLQLLDRAKDVEDILKIQRETYSVQTQIEQIQGRINYLQGKVQTSLVSVNVQPATSPESLVDSGWSPVETIKSAIRGLSGFGQGFVDILIRIGIFAPVWIPIVGVTWFGIRVLRKRGKKS